MLKTIDFLEREIFERVLKYSLDLVGKNKNDVIEEMKDIWENEYFQLRGSYDESMALSVDPEDNRGNDVEIARSMFIQTLPSYVESESVPFILCRDAYSLVSLRSNPKGAFPQMDGMNDESNDGNGEDNNNSNSREDSSRPTSSLLPSNRDYGPSQPSAVRTVSVPHDGKQTKHNSFSTYFSNGMNSFGSRSFRKMNALASLSAEPKQDQQPSSGSEVVITRKRPLDSRSTSSTSSTSKDAMSPSTSAQLNDQASSNAPLSQFGEPLSRLDIVAFDPMISHSSEVTHSGGVLDIAAPLSKSSKRRSKSEAKRSTPVQKSGPAKRDNQKERVLLSSSGMNRRDVDDHDSLQDLLHMDSWRKQQQPHSTRSEKSSGQLRNDAIDMILHDLESRKRESTADDSSPWNEDLIILQYEKLTRSRDNWNIKVVNGLLQYAGKQRYFHKLSVNLLIEDTPI